jgi:hypothetical protein
MAAVRTLSMRQDETWRAPMTILLDGAFINFSTGWTAKLQVRSGPADTSPVVLTADTIVLGANSYVIFGATASAVAALTPGKYYYGVQLTRTSDNRKYIPLTGVMRVEATYVR